MRFTTAALAILSLSFGATASEKVQALKETAPIEDVILHEKALDEDIALALAPIKSREALDAYVRNTPKAASPIERLSVGGKERFLRSITFNEQGITGFSYDDLEAELTPSQIYRVLSLFGAQHLTKRMRDARIETSLDRALLDAPVVSPKKGTEFTTKGSGDFPSCPTQPCDYEGYKCDGSHSCVSHTKYICMRSC